MQIARWLHLIGVIVWVGGMVFAHFALRPSAQALLEPPQRLPLLAATLGRFFMWVTAAIVLILGSGIYLLGPTAGPAALPWGSKLMITVGVVMIAIFLYLRLVPFRQLGFHVAAKSWPAAGGAMARIRALVLTNLILGAIAVSVAILGR